MPSSISVVGSSNVGLPAAGTVLAVKGHAERPAALVHLGRHRGDLGERAPRSASAPAIFSTKTVAPTPRRPAV